MFILYTYTSSSLFQVLRSTLLVVFNLKRSSTAQPHVSLLCMKMNDAGISQPTEHLDLSLLANS